MLACTGETKYEGSKKGLDQSCTYDTDCKGDTYCNTKVKICSKLNINELQQCTTDAECINESGDSLCLDKSKPCQCSIGKCKTFNPCESNPCSLFASENKTKCTETSAAPFYSCGCAENFKEVNGSCEYDCNAFGSLNASKDGCVCNNKYVFKDGNCFFDCSETPYSHANDANNACECDFGYKLVGNSCIYDCSEVPNSHPNEDNNDCTCDDGYFQSLNFCCQANSTYKTESSSCECNQGYHLSDGQCVLDTICTTNPCTGLNEVCKETDSNNYTCECATDYHRTGNICCPEFHSSNNDGNNEQCVPDYAFCEHDGDCTDGKKCTLNEVNNQLITYCSLAQNPDAKHTSIYCTADTDCLSNLCVQYADDDNDPSNGYHGYCAQICNPDTPDVACQADTCGAGTCSIEDNLNIIKCECPLNQRAMGDECKTIAIGQGNMCGVEPELVINKSGVYQTSNKQDDGYTNNYQASCNPNSFNNESVFRLDIEKDSLVIIETITQLDTVIYLRETCSGPDIACSDDAGDFTLFFSKIVKPLEQGTYYLFVDSMVGENDVNRNIEFRIKIIGHDVCPRGSECLEKEITMGALSKTLHLCEPKQKDGELITNCYTQDDCQTGKTCSYDPYDASTKPERTLGCITPNSNCTADFEENYTNGGACCSNYSAEINSVDTCQAFCNSSLDCPTAYNCEPFTIVDQISTEVKYNSQLDQTNTCNLKLNACKNDFECTDPNKNFCTLKDNEDGRLYSVCSKRSGFNKNIGQNCSLGGYNNCYNYACLIPGEGINPSSGATPYCTAPCQYNSNCPDGYTCKEATMIYPENDDTNKTCKRTVDDGCVSYNMKVCVQD